MVPEIGVEELQRAVDEGALLLDVRTPAEFAAGHVPGAVNIPMHLVPLRYTELAGEGPVHVLCETGGRSWQIASWLERQGVAAVNVAGGTTAWRARGLPLVR